VALRGGDETLVSTLGIITVVDGEGVIARLGEGVDLGAPAITAVSPTRDGFAFLGNGLVEVSERRSLGFLLAQVGLDPLSGHHDTGLILLRDVDLLLRRILAKKGRAGWKGWEAVERSEACMAAIGVGEFERRIG